MKLSLKWLKEFINIPSNYTASQLADLLTLHTAEVDEVIDYGSQFANMVIGIITKISPHKNADKLKVVLVDIGPKTVKIVCGGSNLKENMLVPVALPGSKVRWHGEGDLIELSATSIRGEDSYGMICASSEIGLGNSQGNEIMDLSHLQSQAGTPLDKALKKDFIIFDIDNKAITHRPDLWSIYGFARELAVLTESQLKPYQVTNYETHKPENKEELKVKFTNPEIVKSWNTIVIDGITVEESPLWLQSKLESVGLRPVNNIVDITNFIMWELGQPLHAYDKQLLKDLNVEIRFAKNGEKLETIDHKVRDLTKNDPVLIRSDGTPIMLLGIMGGVSSEVSEHTTSIVLESACFDPVIVRRSATHHGLRSESSMRFEKSLDPQLCKTAIFKAIEMILELCPTAKLQGPLSVKEFQKDKPSKINLRLNKLYSYLGFELEKSKVISILNALEFETKEKKDTLEVTVPSFRATKDIVEEVDLIEEVIRIYGFNNIYERSTPETNLSLITNTTRKKEHKCRDLLTGFGFDELINYSFYSKTDIKKCTLTESNHLSLKNFLSEDQSHLRTTLLINILKNVEFNLKHFSELNLFEIGRTYTPSSEFFPIEEEKLAICTTEKDGFFKLKGVITALTKFLINQQPLFTNSKTEALDTNLYHPNKNLNFYLNDFLLGQLGEIHPLLQENMDISVPIYFAEINLGFLLHQKEVIKTYAPICKFPQIKFDLSVVTDKTSFYEEFEQAIHNCSPLIFEVNLFDIYEGDNIAPDKRALTFKIALQDMNKTLTDQDLTTVQTAAIKAVSNLGGVVRGA